MSDRPFSLIEILVAEFELQAEMNGGDPLPCPYANKKELCQRNHEKTISEICDDIDAAAYFYERLSLKTQRLIKSGTPNGADQRDALKQALTDDFNRIIQSDSTLSKLSGG